MRVLGWILLGLLIGSFATLSMVNALQPAAAVHKGIMNLLRYHQNAAREVLTAERCEAPPKAHFEALDVLARDIQPVFLPIGERDELFAQYAEDLLAATRAAALGSSDCAQASEQFALIGDACKACHRDFK